MEIALSTTEGTHIPNGQITEISSFELNSGKDFDAKYGRMIRYRSRHFSLIYNCHGLTFANRRTAIFDDSAIQVILREDGYEEVDIVHVLPGDIVLYIGEDGSVDHSGIVVSEPDGMLKIPLVMSKWAKYAEVVHCVNQCPYPLQDIRYYRVNK